MAAKIPAAGVDLDGAVTINESSNDKDFRVESNANANALHVDGGNSSVGINTTGASDATLEIHDSVSLIKMQDTDDNTFSRMYHSAGNFLIDVDKGDTGSNSYFQLGIDDEQVMKIYTDGEMTLAKQPSFRVLSADMTNVQISQYHNIQFNSELFDIGSNFDTSNYTFTAPVTGKYVFSVQILLTNVDTAAGYYGVRLEASNHAYWDYLHSVKYSEDPTYLPINFARVMDMDANDTAYVRMYQYQGSAQTDVVSGSTVWQGMLIG